MYHVTSSCRPIGFVSDSVIEGNIMKNNEGSHIASSPLFNVMIICKEDMAASRMAFLLSPTEANNGPPTTFNIFVQASRSNEASMCPIHTAAMGLRFAYHNKSTIQQSNQKTKRVALILVLTHLGIAETKLETLHDLSRRLVALNEVTTALTSGDD